jgi:hypothetical protein
MSHPTSQRSFPVSNSPLWLRGAMGDFLILTFFLSIGHPSSLLRHFCSHRQESQVVILIHSTSPRTRFREGSVSSPKPRALTRYAPSVMPCSISHCHPERNEGSRPAVTPSTQPQILPYWHPSYSLIPPVVSRNSSTFVIPDIFNRESILPHKSPH